MTQTGYRHGDQGLVTRSMPPLEFAYSQPQIQPDVLTLDPDSQANLPEGLDGSSFRWVDLDGEGLSGILSRRERSLVLQAQPQRRQPGRPAGRDARRPGPASGRWRPSPRLPSRSDLSGVRLLDLSGSGRLDVVDLAGPDPGFFERTRGRDVRAAAAVRRAAGARLVGPERQVHRRHRRRAGRHPDDRGRPVHRATPRWCGDAGFDAAQLVRPGWDEEKGPSVVLADGTQTIFIADMSGDGLSDIVRVRNGEACYWPNIGYGRFGAKVTMDLAPRFDNEERFDPRRIRLADIDGSGTADLLYVGEDGVTAWFNQSGNAWSAPTAIARVPRGRPAEHRSRCIDLLGTGTACLVWSSPLPGETARAAALRRPDGRPASRTC